MSDQINDWQKVHIDNDSIDDWERVTPKPKPNPSEESWSDGETLPEGLEATAETPETDEPWRAHAGNVGHGMSLGLDRPAFQLTRAIMSRQTGGPSFGERYRQAGLEYERRRNELNTAANVPAGMRKAEEIAGSLPTYIAGGAAASVPMAMGQAAAENKSFDITRPTMQGLYDMSKDAAITGAITYVGGKAIEAAARSVASYIGKRVADFRRLALEDAANAAKSTTTSTAETAEASAAPSAGTVTQTPVQASGGVETTLTREQMRGGYNNAIKNRTQEAIASGMTAEDPSLAKAAVNVLEDAPVMRGGATRGEVAGIIKRGLKGKANDMGEATQIARTADLAEAQGLNEGQQALTQGEAFPLLVQHPQGGVPASSLEQTVAGRGRSSYNPAGSGSELWASEEAARLKKLGEYSDNWVPGRQIESGSGRLPGESMDDFAGWKLANSKPSSAPPGLSKVPGESEAEFIMRKFRSQRENSAWDIDVPSLPKSTPFSSTAGGMIQGAKDAFNDPLAKGAVGALAASGNPKAAAGVVGSYIAKGGMRGLRAGISNADKARMLDLIRRSVSSEAAKILPVQPLSQLGLGGHDDPRQP